MRHLTKGDNELSPDGREELCHLTHLRHMTRAQVATCRHPVSPAGASSDSSMFSAVVSLLDGRCFYWTFCMNRRFLNVFNVRVIITRHLILLGFPGRQTGARRNDDRH